MNFKMKGEYIISKGTSPENMREVARFDNLITDLGLDTLTTRNVLEYCYVGTGNSAPVASNTQLDSVLARQSIPTSPSNNVYVATPPMITSRWSCQFPPGAGTGNIAEIGVGWGTVAAHQLFSRALIKDEDGNPTTITKLAEDYLDVTYVMNSYIDTNDVVQTFTYKDVERTVISRPCQISSWTMSNVFNFAMTVTTTSQIYSSTSVLGTVTGIPSEIGRSATSALMFAKISGEYKRRWSNTWTITAVTTDNLIGCDVSRVSGILFQGSYSPPLEKNNTEVLTLSFSFTWGRKD